MQARLDPGWRIALAVLAWGGGLAAQMAQAALPSTEVHLACLGAGLGLLAWRRTRRHALGLALAMAALAFGSTGWRAEWRLAQRLPAALEGVDLRVTGVVATMPEILPDGLRFVFEVEHARSGAQPVVLPTRVSLGWYAGVQDAREGKDGRPGMASAMPPPVLPAVRAGQRWELPVRLRQPHGLLNPHGFDAELWMFERELGANGYVRTARDAAPPHLLADAVAHPVQRLRQHLRDAITAKVPDARAAGVLAALVVGDQGAIERADWDLFRQTGVAHLMSISGVHVTMFAWLAGGLIGALWRRAGPAPLLRPVPHAARWGGLAVAAAYALLAGWGVPAQRTVLMLAAAALLRSLGAQWPWALVLAVAGAVVTLVDPWAVLQPGFWLSFAAVGLLLMSEPAQRTPQAAVATARSAPLQAAAGLLRTTWRSQLAATLGLAPLSVLFFHQVSLVGLLANLVAIPLVTLLITPLALLGALLPGLWTLAAWLVQALVQLLAWWGAWPLAVWHAAAAPAWSVALGLLAAVVAVLPLRARLRLLALPLALPMLAPAVARPPEGAFELVAADVGQGSAVLVRTRTHLLVYDAGPQYSRDSDAGQRVVLPLLRARGERRIDLLMISHRDTDHAGGAETLLRALPVTALASSLEPAHPLRAHPVEHRDCADGQRWQWDGVRFEVLHPSADAPKDGSVRSNALSCVLRIEDAQGRSALLTGDIEAEQELALVARHGERVAAQVLLVPHHGSKGASSPVLVGAVRPEIAVVQAAYRSRFGHPAPEVVARWQAAGATVVRTDRCGAWSWRDDAFRCERAARRRYWHAPDAPAAPAHGAVVAKPLPVGETPR